MVDIWIKGSEKKWNCERVNKCLVILDNGESVYLYYTDWPEPEGEYRYFFPSWASRKPIPCDCKPNSGEDNK